MRRRRRRRRKKKRRKRTRRRTRRTERRKRKRKKVSSLTKLKDENYTLFPEFLSCNDVLRYFTIMMRQSCQEIVY